MQKKNNNETKSLTNYVFKYYISEKKKNINEKNKGIQIKKLQFRKISVK